MRSRASLLLIPGLVVLVIGLIVPAVTMLFFPRRSGPAEVFAAFGSFFTDPFMLAILWRTVWIGLVVTGLCVLIGFPIAYMLARSNSRWVGLLLALAIFPLLLSNVVRTFGWLVVLGSQGVLGRLARPGISVAEWLGVLALRRPGLDPGSRWPSGSLGCGDPGVGRDDVGCEC